MRQLDDGIEREEMESLSPTGPHEGERAPHLPSLRHGEPSLPGTPVGCTRHTGNPIGPRGTPTLDVVGPGRVEVGED